MMREDRTALRFRRMPAEGAVHSQGVLEVFQGDYQGSYGISPWPVTMDGTEITIHGDDWDMDRFYGKVLVSGAPYNAARKLFPGVMGAGFIIQAGLRPWAFRAGYHRTVPIHRIRVMK